MFAPAVEQQDSQQQRNPHLESVAEAKLRQHWTTALSKLRQPTRQDWTPQDWTPQDWMPQRDCAWGNPPLESVAEAEAKLRQQCGAEANRNHRVWGTWTGGAQATAPAHAFC